MSEDDTGHLEELKLERERDRVYGKHDGGLTQKIGNREPKFTAFVSWVWATIGGIAIMVGIGVYNKLSEISDTLILAVADIKNQGTQVAELKVEVRDLRNTQGQMQRQLDSLEGKTMRGIEEIKRGN
jgi:hypothetical protein